MRAHLLYSISLKNKIEIILLADTCPTRYDFIYEKFAEKVCQIFEIIPLFLIKQKQI